MFVRSFVASRRRVASVVIFIIRRKTLTLTSFSPFAHRTANAAND
jgi:hypothetical protein